MAELSSGKEEKSFSRTSSFNKMLGKSPSRSFSKKNSGLFKKIFSRNKSDKTNDSEAERDPSISNEEEANYSGVIEDTSGVVSNILKKAAEDIPKVVQDNITTIIQQAGEVVPKAVQELIQETKNVDPLPESTNSTPEEEREKINEEPKEKAKESGLEEVYNASLSTKKEKEPLDAKETQERSVDINEVQERETLAEDDKQEDNCVASLAQGLQKICAQWNNKKQD